MPVSRTHDVVNDPRLAPSPTRPRPGRHIPFEPLPRLTPSAPPRWVKQEAEAPSAGSAFARFGVWTLLALGWLVFAAWWAIVLTRETTVALVRAGGLLAAMLVVCAVVMSVWTRYNKWVARRGKRGRSSLFIPMQWERDTLGRPLAFPANDAARTAAEVRVVLREGVKAYVVDEEASL